MVTMLTDRGTTEVARAGEGGEGLWLDAADAERATGWRLKPEGFCRGEVCVPVPPGREDEFTRGARVDVAAFWRLMGRPAVRDESGETWLLGAGADDRAAALESLEAPDFTLPDLDGNPHSLSDRRGKKVLLATWASW
jgi:hypothetical protein